jgi:hypothetical protein
MQSPASHHGDPGSISDQSIWGISGFRREDDENCALLGYYAANSGIFFYRRSGTSYRSHLQVSSSA